MESLNTIKIIHAADADQHLGHLKKILDALKNENRIKDYSTLESDAVNENSLASLSDGDMVITLLTNGIGPVKTLIEETMLRAKTSLPEAKMAEIIIDHVPYENQFIAFPSDLQPIRSREDMDGVWDKIGQTLREIFPVQEEPAAPVAPVPWKKYLPYVLGALALIILFLIIPAPDGEMEVVSVDTSVASLETGTDECPKQFDFEGTIKVNAPGKVAYTWVRSDGQPSAIDTLNFAEAGEKQVSSSWVLGSEKKKYEEWQQLKILSPNAMVSDEEAIVFECTGNESASTGSTGSSGSTGPVIPTLSDVTATAQVSGDEKIQIDCGKRHRFSFSGIIKANGKGKVNYAWVGNDGKTSPMQTLVFQKAGSQRVNTTKTLVANSENGYEGWQQLKILTPSESYSDVAKFILVCKKKVETIAAQIKLTALSPTSPRTLKVGERVNFKFAYQTKWPGKVRIFGRPMTNGNVSRGYGAHGSKELPGSGGQEDGYFTINTAGSTVDQIRFQIWDEDQKKLINETFVPVNYKFAASTTTSGVDVNFTNLGRSRTIRSDHFRKQGIRSVKARPSGNYCATAIPAILAKGTSRAPVSFLSTATPAKLNSCNTIVLEFVFNSPVKQVTVYFYGAAVDNKLTAYRSNGTRLGSRTKKAVPYNYTRPYSVTYSSTRKDISKITFGYQAAGTMITRVKGQ